MFFASDLLADSTLFPFFCGVLNGGELWKTCVRIQSGEASAQPMSFIIRSVSSKILMMRW